MTEPAPTAAPSQAFTQALPTLRRLEEELATALLPAMRHADQPCGYSAIAWMLSKLLRYLLQAAASGDQVAEDLAEVEADAEAVLHHVHPEGGRPRGGRARRRRGRTADHHRP
jgi:hypothetical protein